MPSPNSSDAVRAGLTCSRYRSAIGAPVADGLPGGSPWLADALCYAHLRQLADKARRAMINLFSVQTAGFRIGQRQLLHGAGLRRRRPSGVLSSRRPLHQGPSGSGTPFFDADDEHLRELQPFRRVQGHQLNRVLPGVRLPSPASSAAWERNACSGIRSSSSSL